MKKRSGNGTSSRQWLYMYVHFPLFFLVKLGISGNYKRRAKQVGNQTMGWAIPIFAVKIPFAWQCEQAMHWLFRWFSIRFFGSREWYVLPILPIALAIMALALILDWLVLSSIVVLALWWLGK